MVKHMASLLSFLLGSLAFLVALFGVTQRALAAPDFADLYAIHSHSVVTIHTRTLNHDSGQLQGGLGSGVLIAEDQILTAAHVVSSADQVRVQFSDGVQIAASVQASLEGSDIALLKLERAHDKPIVATIADSDLTRIGEPVFVIGSPFGISQTLSIGHLSGRMNRGMLAGSTPIEFLQTDTAINTGNSGGPMFNISGEVIGIVSFILSKGGGFDGIGFATSSNTAKEALLQSSGLLAGFEGMLIDDNMAKLLNLPHSGLLVQRVVEDSMAAKAGLRAGQVPATISGQNFRLGGDVILEINGLVCRTPHDYQQLNLQASRLDEENTYSLRVFREGEELELIAGNALNGGILPALKRQ